MLTRLAQIAVERGCSRFEWVVLDWNEPAIRFYESLGARIQHSFRVCRMDGGALEKLAGMSGFGSRIHGLHGDGNSGEIELGR